MFKLNMAALRKTANREDPIPANAANFTRESAATPHKLAALAALAGCSDSTIAATAASNDPTSAEPRIQENLTKPQFAAVDTPANLERENFRKLEMPVVANEPVQVSEFIEGDAIALQVTQQMVVSKEPVRSEVRTETAVSSSKVFALISNTSAQINDPDRWCWPHSLAMTGREIDTFAERSAHFNRRGQPALNAELLADRLVNRDRDSDDRHLCVGSGHSIR